MCSCGQKSDMKKEEDELIQLEKEESEQFDETFKNLIHSNPATMDYPFSKLQGDRIVLLESSDKNVRIYSYHTHVCLNGCAYNLFQFRSNGKIFTADQLWFHEYYCWDNHGQPEYISDIKTLVNNNKTYYLIFAGKYNCGDYGESEFGVTAFSIENNMLKTAPIFKISDKILPNIFICAIIDNGAYDESDYTFFYDEKEKILFVPETTKGLHNSSPYIDDSSWLTGKWIKYQFIDSCFQICEGG